ncbi:MAG: HEAT repeat domain-containing protein [Treponema sp.]|nr:HEAT repeat domain-containing protein [Treponema sp.]
MMTSKRFVVLLIVALYAVSAVMGQSGGSRQEMSIEESYLQEAIELMIIRETARSDSREQKLIALESIESAIERGSTNDELRVTLEYLSLEGTQNRTRQSGRLVNNFPDIRRQAAKHLGSVKTEEAKNSLLKICNWDNEPMVLQEAVKSLGLIGLNDNGDVVNTIVWITTKFHNSDTPDNLLALAAIETLEKIVENEKKVDPSSIQLIGRILESSAYARPVRERARQALVNMRKHAAGG